MPISKSGCMSGLGTSACLSLAIGLSGTTTALAQMALPSAGNQYIYLCNSSIKSNYQEVYTVRDVNGDAVTIEVDDGANKNWYSKPFYLLPTSIAIKQNLFGRNSASNSISNNFKELADLKIGSKVSEFVVEERSDPREKLNWSYTVSVTGTETLYIPQYGDIKVVAVNETRWVNRYSSDLVVYYSPELKFPAYWNYRDSNLAEVECTLDSVKMTQAAFAPTSPSAQPSDPKISELSLFLESKVNAVVRNQPNRDGDRAGGLRAGQRIKVTGETETSGEKWYRIAQANGDDGFVLASLLVSISQSQAESPLPTPKTDPSPQPTAAASQQLSAVPEKQRNVAADQSRLARLNKLLADGLITQEEYDAKRSSLAPSDTDRSIAEALKDANRRFRLGELTPEDFVNARGRILASITPDKMEPTKALVLLKDLLDEKLISQVEYARKRQMMIEAL